MLGITDMRGIRNHFIVWALFSYVFFNVQCSHAEPSRRAEEGIVGRRIANRTFPSVFQAWNSIENKPEKSELELMAMHDLVFTALLRLLNCSQNQPHQSNQLEYSDSANFLRLQGHHIESARNLEFQGRLNIVLEIRFNGVAE